ncbi:hypothetical protein GCM10008957_32750 [Deinococcus ruber]|uniref:NACHT domain-containing protein n=1 Tax=Deinococcus ruber TaxID=1848197 RepID=A0A918CD13_9DEIO|nr:hypothetical protein GCM10008957_32750 [Deinococcus ruber]
MQERRRSVEDWLTGEDAAVLLGGPGSGKSTLLRYLTLDLLSDAPTLKVSSGRWAGYLPIWVPFAYWTRLIASRQGGSVSLTDVMQSWLHDFDAERLIALVTQALDDRRLLLIVDGLDEYAQESFAGLALDRLRVYTQERQVPVVLSSRPKGYELFRGNLGGWPAAQLANLSLLQQRQLAHTWLDHQLRPTLGSDEETITRRLTTETDAFFEELAESSDLSQLAGVPLLLCLLISLRRTEVVLPRSRFRVYDSVVQHLLEVHPRRRLRAASVAEPDRSFSLTETLEAYAYLGYHLQCHHPEGIISIQDASTALITFFQDTEIGLGLTRIEARRAAENMITVGETSVGLLVRRSPHDLGFFHRTLQEFLASRHLSRLEDVLDIFTTRRVDAQWTEVLLGTMSLTQSVKQVREMVEIFRGPGTTVRQEHHLQAILAEIAFGEFNVPTALALELAKSALTMIEQETWPPQRERLLNYALNSLQSARVRNLVQAHLKRWFPEHFMGRSYVLRAMGSWPPENDTISLLLRGLYEEDLSNRKAAAQALAQFGSQLPNLLEQVIQIAREAHSIAAQAGALRTLTLWPETLQTPQIQEILRLQASSPSIELRLLAYFGLAQLEQVTDEHLEDALTLLGNDFVMDFRDRGLLATVLLRGWPGNLQVRDYCLSRERLSEEQWRVLFGGFASDELVIHRVVQELQGKGSPFVIYHSAMADLLESFKDVPEIVKAIDNRINRGNYEHNPRDLYFAALVGRTTVAKAALIGGLREGFIHWAAQGLLDGWGMDDPDVRSHLLPLLTSNVQAGNVGSLIPEILQDDDRARALLIELLQDPECRRKDFVIAGLKEVGAKDQETAIIATALTSLDTTAFTFSYELTDLLALFPTQPRLLEYASAVLDAGEWASSQVALHLRNNPAFRDRIRTLALPMDIGARLNIATKLRQRIGETQEMLTLLEKYRTEPEADVRSQCMVSLALRSRAEGRDLEPLITQFRRELQVRGIQNESTVQGAVSALLTLGSVNVISEEFNEPNVLKALSEKTGYTRANSVFLTTIAQHWTEFNQPPVSDETILKDYDIQALMESLCDYASDFPQTTAALLEVVRQNSSLWPNISVLQFLARTQPEGQLLLEACLAALESARFDLIVVAARLLGRHFSHAAVVVDHLLQGLEDADVTDLIDNQHVLITLAEVAPEHPWLTRINTLLQGNYRGMSYPAAFRLFCLFESPDFIIRAIQGTFKDGSRNPHIFRESITPPIIRRAKNDPEFVAALREWLRVSDDASVLATVPRLLLLAGQFSENDRNWCETEIQRSGKLSAIAMVGVDLFFGGPRPLLHSLLDTV